MAFLIREFLVHLEEIRVKRRYLANRKPLWDLGTQTGAWE